MSLSPSPLSPIPLSPPPTCVCFSPPQFDFRPFSGSPLIGKGVSHPPQVPQVPPPDEAVGGASASTSTNGASNEIDANLTTAKLTSTTRTGTNGSGIDVGAYQNGEPRWVPGCTFNAGC